MDRQLRMSNWEIYAKRGAYLLDVHWRELTVARGVPFRSCTFPPF